MEIALIQYANDVSSEAHIEVHKVLYVNDFFTFVGVICSTFIGIVVRAISYLTMLIGFATIHFPTNIVGS